MIFIEGIKENPYLVFGYLLLFFLVYMCIQDAISKIKSEKKITIAIIGEFFSAVIVLFLIYGFYTRIPSINEIKRENTEKHTKTTQMVEMLEPFAEQGDIQGERTKIFTQTPPGQEI